MISKPVLASRDLRAAIQMFLDDIREWKTACIKRYTGQPPTDGHDQLTYTTGWEPYIAVTRDAEALSFLKRCRDEVKDHFTSSGKWRHGYWLTQEAHHGTEHFGLFLGCLSRLSPDDSVTREHIVDAGGLVGDDAGCDVVL